MPKNKPHLPAHFTAARFFCLLVLLCGLFLGAEAYADVDGSPWERQPGDTQDSAFGKILEGTGITVQDVFKSLSEGFTLKVVVSIKTVLESALLQMMSQVYVILQPAVAAFMVLVVVIFGIKLSTGAVRNARAEIPVLLIKLSLVFLFSTNMAGYVDGLFSATESLMAAVSEAMVGSFFSCSAEQMGLSLDGIQALAPGATVEQYMVWQQLDCIFIRFLGFSVIGGSASIMIGMLVSTFVMGELGVYVMTTGLAAFSGFVFTILRVTYMYISSLLGLAFMLILAPLFIPLILMQATNPYFEKWLKMCLAFLFQPVLLMAFVALMVRVYDNVLFTGTYSIAHALGMEEVTSADEFDMGTILGAIEHGCIFSGQTANSVQFQPGSSQTPETGMMDILYTVFGEMRGGGGETGIRDNVICAQAEKFNPEKILPPEVMASGTPLSRRLEAVFALNDIILAFTALGIITMAMYTMLEIVDDMIRMLVERSFRVKFDYSVPFEKVATEGIKGFGNALKSSTRDPYVRDAQGNYVRDGAGNLVERFGVFGNYNLEATMAAVGGAASQGLAVGLQNGLPFGGYTVTSMLGLTQATTIEMKDGSDNYVTLPRNLSQQAFTDYIAENNIAGITWEQYSGALQGREPDAEADIIEEDAGDAAEAAAKKDP